MTSLSPILRQATPVLAARGDGHARLFDLETDPSEKTNIVDQPADIAAQLQSELRKWQDSVLRSLTGADYR